MADGRVGIILQARMGSTRLPGKVLKPLEGRPMLAHSIERLRACRAADYLILATSEAERDSPLVEFARAAGVALHRGAEDDVLDRFYRCAVAHDFAHIVRATGDNPFVDPEEGDRLIDLHLSERNDYTSAFPEFGSGLPIGVGLEVMTIAALRRAWSEGEAPHHREHVNEYIQEHRDRFRQGVSVAPRSKHAPELRLTVDTPEDFARAERLLIEFRRLGGGGTPTTEWLVENAWRA